MKEYIDREALLNRLEESPDTWWKGLGRSWWAHSVILKDNFVRLIREAPTADVVEVDKVAEMLRLMFDDDCACNYNGNDEWLPLVCEHEEECPMPKERLCCWKQFVKHFLAKMDGERKNPNE